ncbi:Gypsy retrotransposon integrase-like protein 1 [Vitis vinifera]|uniref:Gypsy retrotransposon integrase-like protein 1 n=1 Tax=Vitis vinifera TaxID=29760 RepID=A0A438EQQ0_VITVI|nr:Gypsy retrotransposon integrase-like protein 1 [Vitis vinifera]
MSCDPSSWQYEKLDARVDGQLPKRFGKIKHCLMQPPILSSPIPKEKLYMYLAVSEWAISAVLFRCPSPKEQKPIYYVSRALADQAIRLGFSASNNEAEYEAILSGLDLALALSVSKLRIFSDSQLVVKHVQEEYEAKDARMARYLAKVRNTLQQFTEWTIEKIKRADNRRADALAGIAASLPIKEAILLPIHVQTNPSVSEISTCNTIEAPQADGQEWMYDITEYIRTGTLPGDPNRHTKSGRSLAHRAHSQGYYWPTMKKDAAAYVKRCDKCQRYAPIPHMPSTTLKSISGPWPFAQWGMDIVGPLPAAPAQKKFLLVATDYFSKWVEAEAYASIKDKDVTKFVWKNIICRFGIPQTIIADNGPQFDSIAFRNFCSAAKHPELILHTTISSKQWASRSHKQDPNQCLKKRLEQAKGKWVELPGVLWAYRTTPGRPTGNTPFALAYGMDAVIPTEIGLPTIRTDAAKQSDANMELGRNLDWTDEVRESAAIRMADYQQRASAHYNRKVRPRSFKNGTLVLRKVFENTTEVGAGKFQANWEGPYIVSKASKWSLSFTKVDGTPLLRPWNVSNLKQYYQ